MEMVEAEIWTITWTDKGNAVMLRSLESDLVVPIYIRKFEVESILIDSGEIRRSRPPIHELFLSLLGYTGLSLHRIEVYERNARFYARLIIHGGQFSEKKPLVLNANPPDAFALAMRQKCPIYISRKTLKTTGLPADFILFSMRENDKTPASVFSIEEIASLTRTDKYRNLCEALIQAVNLEEYEQAAEIRDQLTLLEKEHEKRQL
jgi:bifunctional DNase/RNase